MSESSPTPHRYQDIASCVLAGTLGINTVKEIRYSQKAKEIDDSGDSDTVVTYLARGVTKVSGTISLADPVQAAALIGQAAGDLVFTGTDEMTGYIVTVTLTGFLAFGADNTQAHEAVSKGSVPFRAISASVADASGS